MQVSIIIPIYNVEQYIRKCLDSLVQQTCKDFEAILISDGSKDNSDAIVHEYLTQYPELFKYYRNENQGVGFTRNFGLQKAAGKYIMFVDSDDYVEPDFVDKMLNKIVETDADVCICGAKDVSEEGSVVNIAVNKHMNNPTTLLNQKDILLERVAVWNKIFKKEMFNGRQFAQKEWSEDLRLVPLILANAKFIAFVDEPLYCYLLRKTSITNSLNIHKNIENIYAFESLLADFKKEGFENVYQEELEFLIVDHLLITTVTRVVTSDADKKLKHEILNKIYDFIQLFPNLYNNSYLGRLSRNRKIIYICNKHKWFFMTDLIFKIKG